MAIHVIHVSGKRMIAQGTNGHSRGSLMEGIMTGCNMLLFVDLGQTASERHPPLVRLGPVLDGKTKSGSPHTGGVV